MPIAIIDSMVISFPRKTAQGDPLTEQDAALLCYIQRNRIVSKIRYLLARGEISHAEVQGKANELAEQPMLPYLTLDDEGAEGDPILEEAMAIARDLIVKRMAEEGLPPPKGLDTHAKALVDNMPALLEQARLRVEAKYRAAEAALARMS
jgi:hypothetical protein